MKNILAHSKVGFLIFVEFSKRQRTYFFAAAAIIAALIFTQMKFNIFYSTNSIRIGLIGTYQEHDLPEEITKLVSQSLVSIDESNRVKPNLVTGWDTNNDATEFKFRLKDNLTWADGEKIKSSDLDFPIPDVTISYPDDQTIDFKLKDSYSPFPSLLTKPIFKKGTFMGIGPYKITKIEKSRVFITKIILTSVRIDLPIVYVRFYPNEKVALTGFSLGEVQALLDVNNTDYFSKNTVVKIKQKTDYTKIVTVLYSMADGLVGGKNRSLRQALSFIAPTIKDEEVANNPYPKNSWAYDGTAKKYLDNSEEASSALERAKTQMGMDQMHKEIILTSTANLEGVGKQVVEKWKSLGFDAKVRVESGIPQNFQALLITQSIPSDPDQYFLWHATQTKTNIAKVDVKRIDKDLEDGRKTINEGDRQLLYFDFQRALLEEAPAIFLHFPKYNIVYLKKSEKLLDKVLGI